MDLEWGDAWMREQVRIFLLPEPRVSLDRVILGGDG